jgi:glucosamine-6-phosphate deaminase
MIVDATGDVENEISRLSEDLQREPIDLGFIGIGENAHIAFNDPPADFETMHPYIVVALNDTCKAQQVREGWFDTIGDVPKTAVSMSVHGILQCNAIISCVPGTVKAKAMLDTLTSAVSPMVPATKLKEHRDVTVYLDKDSAGLLTAELLASYTG